MALTKRYTGGRYRFRQGKVARLERDMRKVKKTLGEVEQKFVVTQLDDAVVSAAGAVTAQMFVIPEGDGNNDRQGRRVQLKHIEMIFQLDLPTTSNPGNTSDILRIIILQDKQANGALPAVNDIIAGTNIVNFKNLEEDDRFRFLLDRKLSINCLSGSFDGTNDQFGKATKNFQWKKRINIPILYDDSVTTGAIASITSNNVCAMYISESGLVGLTARVRFRYTDM